jgi:hypothetical protein
MKDYQAMYEKAQKDETVRRLSPRRIKFEEDNVIVGEFRGRTLLESTKKNMPDFYVYVFETNDGPVQFPISQAFDKTQGEDLRKGGVYALHHGGYQKLDEKRQVKIIDVDIIEEPPDDDTETL